MTDSTNQTAAQEENKLIAERRGKLQQLRSNCKANGHPNDFHREHLAGEEVVVPVSLLAKWKTAVQMTALGCLIGAPVLAGETRVMAETAGLILLWVAAAMTVQTGILYFRAGAKHL